MKLSKFFILAMVLFAFACSKSDDTTPSPSGNNNSGNPPVVKPVWKDSLARTWKVVKATHKGQDDVSSVGLKFVFKKDGTYDFNDGDFLGNWEFIDSTYTKILLDKDISTLKTTWTTTVFTSKKLSVDFKSPFTGGSAHWELEAQK